MFTLHNGDCLQVLPSIPSGSIDAIITDLPYGTTACKWDSIIPFAPMWKEVKRVLKPNGVFVTTASQPFTSALIMSNIEMFKHCWYWEKPKGANFSASSFQPLKVIEDIVLFSDGAITFTNGAGGNITFNAQKGELKKPYTRDHTKDKSGDYMKTKSGTAFLRKQNFGKIEYSALHPRNLLYASTDGDGRVHPTQKPVALYRYLIRTYTNEGETVLDIAMGSGTTGVACVQEGREFIGIEKDTEHGYFSIAESRLKESVLQPNFFTPSNNRLHPDVGDSPAQKDLFTPEAGSAAGKLPKPAPRR